MNNKSTFVDLPIDDFDCLYDNMKNIDIFLYSQALLNYYISYVNKIELLESKIRIKKNPFVETHEAKESDVKQTGLGSKKDNPFEGL